MDQTLLSLSITVFEFKFEFTSRDFQQQSFLGVFCLFLFMFLDRITSQ